MEESGMGTDYNRDQISCSTREIPGPNRIYLLSPLHSFAMNVGSRSPAVSRGLALNNANNSFEDVRSKSSLLLINPSTNLIYESIH